MPLGFGRPKSENVVSLIASKKYTRAIELLRAQLKKRGASTTLRKQLADVLVLAGKQGEAIGLLIPLADQFAREGFAVKAVAILKKIQKIDPGRRDVDERLARLIEEKQREAVVLPVSQPGAEIGLEIGIEPPPSGSIDIPVAPLPPAVELRAPLPPVAAPPAEEVSLDIGMGSPAPLEEPSPPQVEAVAPPSVEVDEPSPILAPPEEPVPIPLAPPPDGEAISLSPSQEPAAAATDADPNATLPVSSVPGAITEGAGWLGLAEEPTRAEAAAATTEIEDYDLLYVPEGEEEEDEAEETPIEELDLESDEAAGEIMTDGAFADELMSLVDTMFQDSTDEAFDFAEPEPQAGPQRTGEQIVVSPLFRDFSVDEMVAVIQGLKLLSFERGDVILRQGQAGGSLYMLTSGRVRAFRKDTDSRKQSKIADLTEGAFFGEMSILTGEPRTASIVALNSCELLELDRATLDGITRTHPHVWDVLREFAEKRSQTRA